MLNIVSLVIGLFSLFAALFAFIPFLGWANWAIIPVAVVGLVCGMLSRHRSGAIVNFIVILVGGFRLMLGGGII